MIEKYRQFASICAETDYGDKKSVRRHNQAVDGMYKIIEAAAHQGQEAISAFIPLLDEPACARWLAHHLLERAAPQPKVEQQCLTIIESLAKGDGANALGEQYWLKKFRESKR